MDFDLLSGLREIIERREFIIRNAPHCPRCREQMQIQVTSYGDVPAKWRCRMCKHRFEFEPKPSP